METTDAEVHSLRLASAAMGDGGTPSFMAECFWPDVREELVEEAAARVQRGVDDLSRRGMPITFVGTILVPEDETVFYLFERASAETVREACERAAIPVGRVVRSVPRRAPGVA